IVTEYQPPVLTTRAEGGGGGSSAIRSTTATKVETTKTPKHETTTTIKHIRKDEIYLGIRNVVKDKETKINIENVDLSIKNITITPSDSLSMLEFTIRRHYEDSIQRKPSTKVYEYFTIDLDRFDDKLNKSFIDFYVPKLWIEQNNINKNKIVLMKYSESEGKWIELPTSIISSDKDNIYYRSFTKGFSLFAIAESSENVITDEKKLDWVQYAFVAFIIASMGLLIAILLKNKQPKIKEPSDLNKHIIEDKLKYLKSKIDDLEKKDYPTKILRNHLDMASYAAKNKMYERAFEHIKIVENEVRNL
ncbi:MAG: PGF-pre-PGF domain-containing protein, partial [Candidatus Aenigmatarchaeota archaeon]